MDKQEQEILFKPTRNIKTLIDISLLGKNKDFCFFDIERSIGYDKPQPDVRRVLSFLRDNNILIEESSIYGVKRYKILYKKLRDFIDNLEIAKLFYKFHNKYHIPPY